MNSQTSTEITTIPPWIRGRVSWQKDFSEVRDIIERCGLRTVCVEGACPNRSECWERRHVTFMILGSVCTRRCLFCNVSGGRPEEVSLSEPKKIARAIKKLKIDQTVITSVTRDDLADQGAGHFVKTVKEIKKVLPRILVELLIPDFGASLKLLKKIAFSGAGIISHNIEMPRCLYPAVRPGADYDRSLNVLKILDKLKTQGADIKIKSSLMLGMGEREEDIFNTINDLKLSGVDILYMGQYLSPSPNHWPVKRYYAPEDFNRLETKARKIGFTCVRSAPMIRSSYFE